MTRSRQIHGVAAKLTQAREFFARDIWEARLDRLPARKARRYRAARLLYRAIDGLIVSDTLHVHAAALTYYTVQSLVPMLALGFALLKGFGGYDALVEETIRPHVLATFAGHASLRHAIEQVLEFVHNTDLTSLGFVGLLLLLWAATRLLHNIEVVFNEIWEVPRGRGPLQRLTHQLAILVVVPICLMLAAALGTLTHAIDVLRALPETLGIKGAFEWSLATFGPLAIVFAALVFLYRVMPNTRVHARSATLGAALGSLMWYAALIVHVRFQVGVARFNALYASFAAVPIFLVWLHISWLVVIVGASIAATHQHERSSTQRRRAARANPALREALCVSALVEITRASLAATPPPGLCALCDALDAPEPLLHDLLQRATSAGLLVQVGAEDDADPHFALARVPERIHVKDVLDALRGNASADPRAIGHERGVDPRAAELLLQFEQELARSPSNRTLRELAEAPGTSDSP
jgi:membrane protein